MEAKQRTEKQFATALLRKLQRARIVRDSASVDLDIADGQLDKALRAVQAHGLTMRVMGRRGTRAGFPIPRRPERVA